MSIILMLSFTSALDFTPRGDGRWGISRIVQEEDGGYTTTALLNRVGATVEAYYPPFNGTGYVGDYALIRVENPTILDNETILFPQQNSMDETIASKTTVQARNTLNQRLNSSFKSYTYRSYDDSIKTIQDPVIINATTTYKELVSEVYEHLEHSAKRQKLFVREAHNTEYTDNFDTQPFTSRWYNQTSGTGAAEKQNYWNSTTLEFNADNTGETYNRYWVNTPGSIDMEAQITSQQTTYNGRVGTIAVRMYNNTNRLTSQSGYTIWYESNTYNLNTYLNGVRTQLAGTSGQNSTPGWFYTDRMAVNGSVGGSANLTIWRQPHYSSTKPSDPGWYGDNAFRNLTYIDSGANRHDDANQTQAGQMGRGRGTDALTDTHFDYFKIRALTDRNGGGGVVAPVNRLFVIGNNTRLIIGNFRLILGNSTF